MRITSIIAMIMGLISAAATANVFLNVFESDGITPFDDRYIPVGTELKLVVTSDANDCWSGGLFLQGNNRDLAALSGGESDPNSWDWPDCHLHDAGTDALVMHWEDSVIDGFDLFTGWNERKPGSWFEIEYTALAPGEPNVGFYEYANSWSDPNEWVTFRQVPASDFTSNGIVNLEDYQLFASCWLRDDLTGESECIKADLYPDGVVDLADLILFSNDWLCGIPEPNQPDRMEPIEITPDPNLIFRIVDENGMSEISLEIGQTVTLYVEMLCFDTPEVWSFMVESNISDTNLGNIDNTAYDPNNPPGDGTARILAGPERWTAFDRWGPGYDQVEGIFVMGLSSGDAFDIGSLARFEFTAQQPGDVSLSLLNRDVISTFGEKLYPTLEGITIHQAEPAPLLMMSSGMSFDMQSTSLESTSIEPASSLSPEEMVQVLEDIWLADDTLKKEIPEELWMEFIKAVSTPDETEIIKK